MSSNESLKSLNLIIKKNKSKSGYKVITSSSVAAAAILNKKESSLSPTTTLSPSSSSNSLCSSINMATVVVETSTVEENSGDSKNHELQQSSNNNTLNELVVEREEELPHSSTLASSSSSSTATETETSTELPSYTVDKNNNPVKDDDSDGIKQLTCDFCQKTGSSSEFCGRFCSKRCVIRYAQKRGAMMKIQKKRESVSSTTTSDSTTTMIHVAKEDENENKLHLRNNSQSSHENQRLTSKRKEDEDEEADANKTNKKFKLNNENNRKNDLVLRIKTNYVNSRSNSNSSSTADFSIKNEPVVYDKHNELQTSQLEMETTSNDEYFNWESYLKETNSIAAPESCFINPFPKYKNNFQVGMLLEGNDIKHTSLICVLRVAQVQGYRIRLHFEGYDSRYDFWRNANSTEIYPVEYCKKHKINLMPPLSYKNENFDWNSYLKGKKAAPEILFVKSHNQYSNPSTDFEIGMKLEAVDKYNPMLIRVATVVGVNRNEIKVHYDSWPDVYNVSYDKESSDIHPIKWCEKTGHTLTQPSIHVKKITACPNIGCSGLGHIKGYRFETHYSDSGCPYSLKNINRENMPDRLAVDSSSHNTTNLIPFNTKAKTRIVTSLTSNNKSLPLKEINSKLAINRSSSNNGKILRKKEPIKHVKYDTRSKSITKSKKQSKGEMRISKNEAQVLLKNVRNTLEEDIHETVYMSSSKPIYNFPFHVKYNKNLITGIDKYSTKEIKKWKCVDVSKFIKKIPGCETSSSVFMHEQIDGQAFLLLEEKDLIKVLNIQLGPAIKIYNVILAFRQLPQSNC